MVPGHLSFSLVVPGNLGLITGYLVWGPGYRVRVPSYPSLALVTLVWSCSTLTGHFVHPWHFVHPDIWSTWTFGLKTTRTPWHIVPRQLVYPDILSKDNSYTLTFHTPYFVMSWLKYQRVYQMSWTFRTPFPYRFLTERVYQMSWTFGTPFSYRFLTERVYQMSWTFGTPFPCSLLAPDIWYTLTFGTPRHLIHPRLG